MIELHRFRRFPYQPSGTKRGSASPEGTPINDEDGR